MGQPGTMGAQPSMDSMAGQEMYRGMEMEGQGSPEMAQGQEGGHPQMAQQQDQPGGEPAGGGGGGGCGGGQAVAQQQPMGHPQYQNQYQTLGPAMSQPRMQQPQPGQAMQYGMGSQGHSHLAEHLTGVPSNVGMGQAPNLDSWQIHQGPVSGAMPGSVPGPGAYQGPQPGPQYGPMYGPDRASMGYAGYAGHATGYLGGPQPGPMYGPQPGSMPGPQPATCGPSAGGDCSGHSGPAPSSGPSFGEFFGMARDVVDGKADPARMIGYLESCDSQFWKGLLVGAGIALILGNPSIRSTITDTFSGLISSGEETED